MSSASSGSGEERTWTIEKLRRLATQVAGTPHLLRAAEEMHDVADEFKAALRAEREAREKAERELGALRQHLHPHSATLYARAVQAEERLTTLRHTTVARLCHERDLFKGRAEKAEEALRSAGAAAEDLIAKAELSEIYGPVERLRASLSAVPVQKEERNG